MLTLSQRLKDETDILQRLADARDNNLRVAAPGIIRSFNAAKQTAVVQIAIREKVNVHGKLSWMDIPLLLDVPVYFPRAGGYMLTLPIKPDDECLVIFADFCIDAWWQSGGVQNQLDKRRHDLSDGFALVGVTSQPRKVTNYAEDTIQLRNEAGTTYAEIDDTTFNISTPGPVNVHGGTVNVTGSTIAVTGDSITINGGSVTIGATTTIDGKSFLNHTHGGVMSGGATTGGVS
jgi:hypothetical protein